MPATRVSPGGSRLSALLLALAAAGLSTAALERQPQVLAASLDPADGLPEQLAGRDAERPAQGLADAHRGDARPFDPLRKAQAGDFDFGKLGHEIRGGGELSRPRRIALREGALAWPCDPSCARHHH